MTNTESARAEQRPSDEQMWQLIEEMMILRREVERVTAVVNEKLDAMDRPSGGRGLDKAQQKRLRSDMVHVQCELEEITENLEDAASAGVGR